MPDVAVATSDAFATKLAGAATDDNIVMGNGEHVTPTGGTARSIVNKRVVIRATGYGPLWDGRWVSSGEGHAKADWPVQWRGGWTWSTAGATARGLLFNGRMTGGPGSFDMRANSLLFEDCGFTDEFFGYIMCHAENLPSNIIFRRCRFWNIGERSGHDHPIYWKQVTTTLGRCLVEDSIFYNCTGWAMHAYPNGDGVLYKRCLVYRCNGAGVFSAEGGDSTSGAGFENCLLVDARGYEIGAVTEATFSPDYLVETNGAGTGYVQNTMAVNNAPGPGVVGTIESAGITKTNVLETGTPLWLAGANPGATGDFRLDPNPANPALGYGPTYIQPSSEQGGDIGTEGSVASLAVTTGASAVLFRNDPDRVTPGG